MVKITIHGNFNKLESSLSKMDGKLAMLNIPLKELEDSLKKIYDVKFRNFDRHRDKLSHSYRKWKDERGLPVGVKTGKLKKALLGGDGVINRVIPFSKGGFVYEYGVHADSFTKRRGYPRNFDEWLQKHGDDLIGLEMEEAEFLMGELIAEVKKLMLTL